MNTYNKSRHATFLINYHFIWIPKYRRSIMARPGVKQVLINTLDELVPCGHGHILLLLLAAYLQKRYRSGAPVAICVSGEG